MIKTDQLGNTIAGLRDEKGLLKGVPYVFNADGTVNWRALIKPEYLYPNPDFFKNRRLPVPDSVEGLEDKQLLIYLAGLKEVAKIRGFRSVRFDLNTINPEHIQAKCQIVWSPNFESDFEENVYEEFASASKLNSDVFGMKFPEAIACNRAFVRCVRNYLGINIVGADELDKSNARSFGQQETEQASVGADSSNLSPQGLLKNSFISKHGGNDDIKAFIKYMRSFYKKLEDSNPDKTKGIVGAMDGSDDWVGF
jgi:hypothetical protein